MSDARKIRSLAAVIAPLLMYGVKSSHAEFGLNFQPQTGTAVVASVANIDCFSGTGGGMMGMGGCGGDPTPFLQQVVQDAAGNQYYHVIVGDPARGSTFAQEIYIRTAVSGTACWFGCTNARVGGMMGGGGGMMGMGNGPAPLSSSAGSAQNEFNPLSATETISGNGTGNPTRVHMRQINNEAGFTQEFLKARDAFKPKITQNLTATGVVSTFSVDMSSIGYSTNNAAVPIVNTLTLTAPGIPAGSGNFDIEKFTATRKVEAGKYIYTAGTGDGGSFGTYTYVAGRFDVYGLDWLAFCDPAQNPVSGCANFGRGGMMGGGMGGGGMGGGM